jgi:hypothetical protein
MPLNNTQKKYDEKFLGKCPFFQWFGSERAGRQEGRRAKRKESK